MTIIRYFYRFMLCLMCLFPKELWANQVKTINPLLPLQEQFSEVNTLYIINSDCELKGQALTFPSGTMLKFEGGMLKNGVISNSQFYVEAPRMQVFDNIHFTTIIEKDLEVVDPVRVKILNNESFFNIETDALARKGDIVNYRSLYRISKLPQSTSKKGIRYTTLDNKEVAVSDIFNNYTYSCRFLVGIDTRTGKLLQSEIIDRRYEAFFKINPLARSKTSTIKNREIYSEWFGCKADAKTDQSMPINYGISVATDSRSILFFPSGRYQLKSPLIATTNTKMIGVESSPWDVCTEFAVEASKGIIIFDEKACSNVILEGLSFSAYSKEQVEKYIGVEMRTSIKGVHLRNISCFQPYIGVFMHAYADLMGASVDNFKHLSGIYGIVMEPLFKTTFRAAYCNGNKLVIASGGSPSMKKQALFIKNSEGNTITYNAGEQYGNPSVYCDNSSITISGTSWHENSLFLHAVNHSRVSVVGEVYAMGYFLADETSTISYPDIMDSHYRHANISANYHPVDFSGNRLFKMDDKHNVYLDYQGNVVVELVRDQIKYINGNPYCIKKAGDKFTIPYERKAGTTVFMRVCSSGIDEKAKPYVTLNNNKVISFKPSVVVPLYCTKSHHDDVTLNYLIKGESILSFSVKGDSVFCGSKSLGTININDGTLSLDWNSDASTSFMVSDVLFSDRAIYDVDVIREYERFLSESANIAMPISGTERPKLSASFAGYQFFDQIIGHMIVWNGTRWVNFDGSEIK